jgi:hypothetical protein
MVIKGQFYRTDVLGDYAMLVIPIWRQRDVDKLRECGSRKKNDQRKYRKMEKSVVPHAGLLGIDSVVYTALAISLPWMCFKRAVEGDETAENFRPGAGVAGPPLRGYNSTRKEELIRWEHGTILLSSVPDRRERRAGHKLPILEKK